MNQQNGRKNHPYPLTVSLNPENQETPVHFVEDWITPVELMYKRNHFPYPSAADIPATLHLNGLVDHPLTLDYEDLLSWPSKTLVVPLECAGNRRTSYSPRVYGVQWQKGAISQGRWKGVPLASLLKRAGLKTTATEIVFSAIDQSPDGTSYARSLPVEKALHSDTIIAYELNGKPLPFKHGYPFRLIVPGWYAMASVKWLSKITAIDHPFQGFFQTEDYVYYPHDDTDEGKTPVTTMKVNSIIQQPQDYDVVKKGINKIKGFAWTGEGRIVKVEISTDNGRSWHPATLHSEPQHPYAWTFWEFLWEAKCEGEFTIMSRATDSEGRTQPMEPVWNRKGYGYNGIFKVRVKVE
ncbi:MULTISPECIES: sulfite oxidase [Thermoactinomyces]|jgi:sulfite oxidase|uniref:Sulfite oxidase n=1 Tax=Thermoactinomyces daqus TaxID=1329516 RepID=A0A7W1X7J6_9BACL|nr:MULTISPECIES: sulfite oxidase [Thermoactinomyces]MBA4541508.1 sulfite oxidase [Thermoactinomyces daqus]MBH8607605.1 sulfite oxidase [Thermoactinomyces sp. CICC 10521]